jgi:hypothetical protein
MRYFFYREFVEEREVVWILLEHSYNTMRSCYASLLGCCVPWHDISTCRTKKIINGVLECVALTQKGNSTKQTRGRAETDWAFVQGNNHFDWLKCCTTASILKQIVTFNIALDVEFFRGLDSWVCTRKYSWYHLSLSQWDLLSLILTPGIYWENRLI